MMVNPVERCLSGIPGFDKICEGGLVRDNVYIVKGGPGSGKTVFLLNFLWGGLAYRENGAYLTFETDLHDLFKDAESFGWDFEKYDQSGHCRFVRLDPGISERDLEKKLMELVSKHDVRRVCIDPVNIYAMTIPDRVKLRQTIYNLISLLKRMKVTVLLSEEAESDLGESGSKHSNLEFISDGVLHLHSIGVGGEADRAVRIIKMRRTDHIREPVAMKITDKGMVVLSGKK
jgi:circadian clock protein KaiC